jgi:phosphoribosylformylglycinamidine synthase
MVKVIVLRTAGTNCDKETAQAFIKQGAQAELVHINELKNKKKNLSSYHILAIPGGFTYGDDVASGRIMANELKFSLRDNVLKFIEKGKLIIGICNGFQVLVKSGLLPDSNVLKQETTLNLNDSCRFEDRWIYLKVNKKSPCIWTKNIDDLIELPVAHAEGKFMADRNKVDELNKNNQIVFRYVNDQGKSAEYPQNPNGSIESIAGICDKTGRIFGLMPHPERFIISAQNPRFHRLDRKKNIDGNIIFKNAVKYAEKNLL